MALVVATNRCWYGLFGRIEAPLGATEHQLKPAFDIMEIYHLGNYLH